MEYSDLHFNGSDMQFANQIIEEGAASPADVFLTENSPAMALVDASGLFAPVNADTLVQVPDTFKSVDGKWTGVAARSTVFASASVFIRASAKSSSIAVW